MSTLWRRIKPESASTFARMRQGFLLSTGSVTWVAPFRSSSRTMMPPEEATIAWQSARLNACATSTVPRSTPPVVRLGSTCRTTVGRPCSAAEVLKSNPVNPMAKKRGPYRHDHAALDPNTAGWLAHLLRPAPWKGAGRGLPAGLSLRHDRHQGDAARSPLPAPRPSLSALRLPRPWPILRALRGWHHRRLGRGCHRRARRLDRGRASAGRLQHGWLAHAVGGTGPAGAGERSLGHRLGAGLRPGAAAPELVRGGAGLARLCRPVASAFRLWRHPPADPPAFPRTGRTHSPPPAQAYAPTSGTTSHR